MCREARSEMDPEPSWKHRDVSGRAPFVQGDLLHQHSLMQWVGWVEPLLAVAAPFPDMASPPNTHLGVVEKEGWGC